MEPEVKTPAQAQPKPDSQTPPAVKTADVLHDEAIAAYEAYQKTPSEELKKAAQDASGKAKEAFKSSVRIVPEKYGLKLPDGSKLDAAHIEKIAEFSKKHGFSDKEAQALLERDNETFSAYAERMKQQQKTESEAALKAASEKWLAETKNDKEIGGEAFVKTAELTKRVLDRFGNDELKRLLNESGYGNHPEVVRFVNKVGSSMKEDQLVLAGTVATGGAKSMEKIFYPNQAQ